MYCRDLFRIAYVIQDTVYVSSPLTWSTSWPGSAEKASTRRGRELPRSTRISQKSLCICGTLRQQCACLQILLHTCTVYPKSITKSNSRAVLGMRRVLAADYGAYLCSKLEF